MRKMITEWMHKGMFVTLFRFGGQLFYILLTLTVQFLDAIALSTTCANLASQRGVWIDNQHFYIVQCMAFFVLKFR